MSSDSSPLLSKSNNNDLSKTSNNRGLLKAIGGILTVGAIVGVVGYNYNGHNNSHNNNGQAVSHIESEIATVSHASLKASSSSGGSDSVNPNIIYLLVDDMGYSDFSARGSEYLTPNIDELYNNGINIKNHYIGLVCSPSRSQLITGRYAWNMGISNFRAFSALQMASFPSGLPTIGNLLSEYSNYQTYFSGKWHMGYATEYHVPLSRGFKKFSGFYTSELEYDTHCVADSHWDTYYLDWRHEDEDDYETQGTHSTYVTANRMNEYINAHLKEYDETTPFYMHVPFQSVHPTLLEVDSDDMENCNSIVNSYDSEDENTEIDSDSGDGIYEERVLMCQNILAIDQVVGDLVTNLKQQGVWENTLIIMSSDNGGNYNMGACNYPLRGGKERFFEGGIKTFAFVGGGYLDDTQRGTEREEFMHVADWAPTILGLAGVNVDYVETKLQEKLYIPAAKSVSMKQHKTEDLYEKYLMTESLDGNDLSEWLLKGSNDYSRDVVYLSVNSLNLDEDNNDNNDAAAADGVISAKDDEDSDVSDDSSDEGPSYPSAIVFKSAVTGHTYKMFYLDEMLNTHNSEWCLYDDESGQRYYNKVTKSDFIQSNAHLYDLTLETTEDTNLMLYYDNTIENKYYIAVDQETIEDSVTIGKDEDTQMEYNHDIVSQVWEEGIAYFKEEMNNNPMVSEYFECNTDLLMGEVNPEQFGGHYQPFFTFEEYIERFTENCADIASPLLYELFTTKYQDYHN